MRQHPIPDAALAQHIAILGKTGSGKTSTAKLAVEQVVASGARVCILDPIKSDWWGLSSSADGKRPGLPFYILGGPRGHVPLHAGAGKAIGELVAFGALPLSILDMAEFSAGGIQGFFVDFADTLLRKMRGVVHLVIEEAHEFAPKERAGFNAENMAIHFAKKLATAGRSKGIRMILATQRIQSLHNALLGSCDTLIAHRVTAPADQEPIVKWLKSNTSKEVAEKVAGSLSSLRTGTGWICSGEARVFEQIVFPRITTYDNSATPTDDDHRHEVATAAVDLDRLQSIVGDAVREAESADPKKLRSRIADLEKQLRERPLQTTERVVVQNDPVEMQNAYARGATDALTEVSALIGEHGQRLAAASVDAAQAIESAGRAIAAMPIRAHLNGALAAVVQKFESGSPPSNGPERAFPERASGDHPAHVNPPRQPRGTPSPEASGDGTSLTGPQQRMLDVIAFWNGVGYHAPSREQVAAVCGYSLKASTFRVVAGALKVGGLIEYPDSGKLMLTPNGHDRAAALSKDDSKRKLESIMTGAQLKVVGILRNAGGRMARARLIDLAGYSETASTHRVVIGGLKTLEVVDYPDRGIVALTKWATEVLA